MDFYLTILLIAIFTSMASAIVGVFLVLRKMSMMTDAISHTVLLGIVLTYLVVKDLNSPLLFMGAALIGLVTVFLVEMLVKTKKTTEDAATGVIFPLLFSVAIILISLDFRGVHIDIDAVLLGKIEFTILDQLIIFNTAIGPKSLYIMLTMFIINFSFFIIFYKELKIVSFDAALAASLGFMPIFIHYLLMALVSLTAVTAFNAVGSILVIAMMVGPAMSALFITKNLFKTVVVAMIIGAFNSTIGYLIAIALQIRINGVIAVTTLIVFLIIIFFEPNKGILQSIMKRKKQANTFSLLAFLIHIKNHQDSDTAFIENNYQTIQNELRWSQSTYHTILKQALDKSYIEKTHTIIRITDLGDAYIRLQEETHLI